MKSYPYVPSMVQAITVLTVLKMMTKAQTSCGSGIGGRLMYERLPNIQLQGMDDEVVRDTSPPFMVLEKCQDLCLRDRTANNIVRTCSSIDFQPGSRIASFSGSPEYEESTCYLSQEQAAPEGIGILILTPNSFHFTEICITSNRPERECPNRKYIFERHPRKKLKLMPADLKEMPATNRSECQDRCLNEFSFVCRSATFDSQMRRCMLSRFTRRTHPELLEDDPNSDYLENTCLNAERRCDGLAVFIKEENKRLGGPFEVDLYSNITLEECQAMCVRAEKYFCRSIEYDEMTRQCIISEEDSISQKDDLGISSSPTHHFYDFACLDSPRGSEYPDNSVTSHLFTGGKRPDTAFQRYRNSRLGGEHHSEISGRSLSECLDECLRQPSFQCRSAVYSERFRTCRLSRYNQRDGMRIIYDADYDYYENLMLGGSDGDMGSGQRPDNYGPGGGGGGGGGGSGGYRPDDRYPPPLSNGGGDYYGPPMRPYPGDDRDRYPIGPPLDRYPSGGGGGIYPMGGGKYPYDRPGQRFPPGRPGYGGNRYGPSDGDRYGPPGDRYGGPGDRYGGPGDRYGPSGGDRYGPPGDRYPPPPVGDRYGPPGGDRYMPGDRYGPPGGDRYGAPGGDRYGAPGGDRYGSPGGDRYGAPGGDRYGSPGGDRYGAPGGDRYGPPGDRYGGPGDRYGPSSGDRYGSPSDRYPAGPPGDRYPPALPPGGDRYGPSADRYGPGDRYGGNRYDYYGDDRDGGSRWFFRPNRRPGGMPPGYGRPGVAASYGPDGPIYDGYGYGGLGPGRPPAFSTRCEEGDSFKQMGVRQRMRKDYVRRFMATPSLSRCQQECTDSRDFICRSFNYKDSAYDEQSKENCELSDRDSRDMELSNPQYFDSTGNFDYYERSVGRAGADGDCLDVSQVCNEDGMEFTLRTPEGFVGRIYTYGFYDRCFFRGNGGTVNVLRISGAQGYPECGTQRYGDTMTNIVVVQFSDFVQTGKDKRFNLTCLFRGPGEAVVSSGFIGAGSVSGSPIPIEYLPAENSLSSKVRLMILYQGRPTTTIAVGDPLTFRLESQDGYNYVTDIFATNVIARDPYSGRSVQLIDRFGCPVDSYVFPELDRGRSGDSLEARFNAFKIPESNFLVFEATVKTCREGCPPAYCQSGTGRSEPSFGRRKREVNETVEEGNETIEVVNSTVTATTNDTESAAEFPEYVREMIEVYESREELQQDARRALPATETVCLTSGEYNGLISFLLILIGLLITVSVVSGLAYRRYYSVMRKNLVADRTSQSSYPTTRSSGLSLFSAANLQKPFMGFGRARDVPCGANQFEDPSEPIYTDPSLFERSRSLRSIAVSPKRRLSPGPANHI